MNVVMLQDLPSKCPLVGMFACSMSLICITLYSRVGCECSVFYLHKSFIKRVLCNAMCSNALNSQLSYATYVDCQTCIIPINNNLVTDSYLLSDVAMSLFLCCLDLYCESDVVELQKRKQDVMRVEQ